MAAKVGQVIVDFLLNTAKFESDIKKATRSFRNMGRELSDAGRTMTMGVTLPIVGLGAAAVKLAGEFEQTTIAFNTMLGSSQKAGIFLKQLQDFAAKTPFEFKDLTEASKRMLALGFSAEQIIPTMTAVGNAVAALGGGGELINRVTLALGQMQAKGKVSAEEMRQLAEAGIPAWEILANKIGVSIPEAMQMAQRGAISASEAVPAIIAGMQEKFGGLMEKQSQTLLGQISNMKDQFFFMLNDLGTALLPAATAVLNALKPIVEFIGQMAQKFAALPAPMQTVILALTGLAAAIGPVLMVLGSIATGISTILPLLGTFAAALSGPVGIVLAITAVGAAIAAWAARTEEGRAMIGGAWQWLKDAAVSIFGSIKELVAAVTAAISAIWQQHGEQIKLIAGATWDLVKNIFAGAMTALKGIIEGALKILTGIMQAFHGLVTGDWRKFGEGIKNIVSGLWEAVKAVFKGAIQAVTGYVKDMYDRVTGYFKNMYDKVIGHSWVPDMMEGIKTQFGRLPAIMTDPTRLQTGNVNSAFSGLNSSVGAIVPGMISDIGSQFGLLDGLMNGNVITACQNVIGNFKSMISTVTNMFKNWKDTLFDVLGNIGSGILNSLLGGGGLWDGIKGGLGNFLNSSGLGSILGGGSGGGLVNNLLGSGAGIGLSSLLGGGVSEGMAAYAASLGLTSAEASAAVGTGAGTAGGLGSLSTLGSTIWSGVSSIGSAIGSAFSSIASTIGPMLTNPVTAIVGGGLAAGYGLYKLVKKIQGPNSWEALEKEVTRDYGGIKISAENIEKFAKSFGITEKEAWDYRKNISASPQFIGMMATAAEEQGKLNEFLKSLEKMGTSWGEFNFRTPFEQGLASGDWTALNNMWASISKIGDAKFGKIVTGGSSAMLLGEQPITAENTASAIQTSVGIGGMLATPVSEQLNKLITALQEKQATPTSLAIETGSTPIYLTIEGAGDDLVTRIKNEVIPILIKEMTGGNSGLRDAIVKAYNLTAGGFGVGGMLLPIAH